MAEMKFVKHKTKAIPETKAAKPKKRYNPDEDVAPITTAATERPKPKTRKRHKNGTYGRVTRVSDENLARLKALKETLLLNNIDDVLDRALDLLLDDMNEGDLRVYQTLIEVQRRKLGLRS